MLTTEQATSAREDEGPKTYSIAVVIKAIGDAGVEAHPDAVKRASEKFLGFTTRRGRTHHRWTQEQIDALVVAFRLNRTAGVDWPTVSDIFDGADSLAGKVDSALALLEKEMELVLAEVDAIAARAEIVNEIRAELETTAA